jgi:hypothetical protein
MSQSSNAVPSWGCAPARALHFSRISVRVVQRLCRLAPVLAGALLAVDCAQLLRALLCDLALPPGGDWLETALELFTACLSRPAQPANVRRTIASSAGRCWFTLRASASWLWARARLCSLREANLAAFQPK